MRLLLTRHGETQENKARILQGWLPGKLSPKGRKQARQLAQHLKSPHLNYIYTSDLARTVDTATIIAKFHPHAIMIKSKFLRERNLGKFQGKKVSEKDWQSLPGNQYNNKPPGGENFAEVRKRIKTFYQHLRRRSFTQTILIVGHDDSMRLLEGILLGKNLKDTLKLSTLKNGAITEYQINHREKVRLKRRNVSQHLNTPSKRR